MLVELLVHLRYCLSRILACDRQRCYAGLRGFILYILLKYNNAQAKGLSYAQSDITNIRQCKK